MSFAVSLSLLGLVAIAAPMVASVLVALFPRPYAKWFSVLGAAVSTVCTIALAANFAGAGMPDTQVPLISFGQTLVMGFTFDRMSTLLAPAFVGIGLLVVIYSIPYMSENNREHPDAPRRRFYAYLATFIGAMAGLVYSSTLLGQLVFFEITGACSWGLISYYMSPTAKKAGMKALIITHIGALGLYLGAAIVFAHTGTFAITAIAGLDAKLKAIVLLLVLFAAWAKSAQVPMYMWLPSAMEAPTPVSAYLHGASMVKVGVCVFARALVSAGEIPEIVGWVAIIDAMVTMLFGFLMYLPQKDMKRLLAFSTIAQLSYVWLRCRRARYCRRAAHEHVLLEVPDYRRRLLCGCRQRRDPGARVHHGRRDRRHLRLVPQVDGLLPARRAERRGRCGSPASPRDGVRVHRAHHHGHRQRPAFGQLDRLGGRTTWVIRSSTSLAAF